MVDIITAKEAAAMVESGDGVGFPNFFSVGIAYDCANALAERDVKNLTMYGNEVGLPGLGVGKLIRNGQIAKVVVSFLGTNPEAVEMVLNGEMEYEMYPQGTLIFKYWAGAAKMGGILTPVGVGTDMAKDKEIIHRNGQDYILEDPLRCRIAFVKAFQADRKGNVLFWKASANFNNMQARAADITIVEADVILPEGHYINYPDLPYYYVNALVQSSGQNLAHGTKEVIICTKHTHEGESKIVKRCRYPLTGVRNVTWIITELAVFKVTEEGLELREVAYNSNLYEIRAKTAANFRVPHGLWKTFGE